MIIINVKVYADDSDKKPQVFRAEVEVYDGKSQIENSPVEGKDFRKMMEAALNKAYGYQRHYKMLAEKTKVQVDWEQYTFEYDEEEGGFSSDQGLSFKQFLGIFDESREKAKVLLGLIKGL
jgi:hypothetical protein